MSTHIEELTLQRDDLLKSLDDTANRIQALPDNAPEEERSVLDQIFERDNEAVKRLTETIRKRQIIAEQRSELAPQDEDEVSGNGTSKRLSVKEPLVYERNSQHSFFADHVTSRAGDSAARERLARHAAQMRIEKRDISQTAGAGGEMVAPVYLQDQWITLARAGRVTANLMNHKQLRGDTLVYHYPKLTGGSATAIQTADNAAVQETDPTTADYSVAVKTIAGQVDLSRQLYDFSNPGMDEIIASDLAQDYATKLDIQVISGSGSAGQALGIRNVGSISTVTYTQATPTVATLYPKLSDAWQRISTLLYRNADAIVMHPVRWASIQGAVDSAGRPLASAEAPQNAVSRGGAVVTEGLAGSMQGLPVYVDPNLPTNLGAGTNQDIILVMRTAEMDLYEDPNGPRTMTFEDIGSGTLTVRISAFGYFAFAAGRYPAAISLITGTGLVAPTF